MLQHQRRKKSVVHVGMNSDERKAPLDLGIIDNFPVYALIHLASQRGYNLSAFP